jgi:hypothetical protein
MSGSDVNDICDAWLFDKLLLMTTNATEDVMMNVKHSSIGTT